MIDILDNILRKTIGCNRLICFRYDQLLDGITLL